ncbi:MAG: nicotinamide mononucleotide transporter [Saprospiraceae bacterium]|nr:nicotinamide mononucleotide transporter [Saprospiraceae bacterium]
MPDSLLSQMLTEAAAFSWVDWVAILTAIVYVVLAARENPWCWVWGIVSCSLWAYASFVFYNLWLDALLQLFYVAMGFVGLYRWKFANRKEKTLLITQMWWVHHIHIITIGAFLSFFFGYFFDEYTPAAATYLDAFTTIFSIIATFILVQKKLENWLYWVVVDAIYAYLYASRGAYLFMLLMIAYTIIATIAFFRWKRNLVSGDSDSNA